MRKEFENGNCKLYREEEDAALYFKNACGEK
jgi:hypothetical protein